MPPFPPSLLNWIRETLNRLFISKPEYFKYWTWLSYLVLLVSGVPYLLTQFNITLPEPFATLSNKFFSGVGVAMYIMSQLTVQNPVVGQTEQGHAITVLDTAKMPFTTKTEAIDIKESKPPPEVIPEVPEPKKED